MADFLDDKRKEIDSRLQELRPLVDEYNRLEKAAEALKGVPGESSAPATARTGTRRRRGGGRQARGGRTARRTGEARGRPRGSGTRAKQALELVRAKPGITIAELASQMGIKANYLYRVMPTLESEGQVSKRDGGWHPA